jgi:para-aminobenzoate synthetase/4-amino-4-deoxychorismate lyase
VDTPADTQAKYPGMPATLRADPRLGLFETMLVLDGQPVELDAHMERLAASLKQVYRAEPPPHMRALTRERARGIGLGRLRLTIIPGDEGLEAEAVAVAVDAADVFPSRERAARLRSVAFEGGLGAHKWADRSCLDTAAPASPRDLPLLIDADGAVLEASRASIFAVFDGVPLTPPADGRILPGITRERALGLARELGLAPREAELHVSALREAEEVFMVGSVRGVEPASALDGVALGTAEAVGTAIAAGLQRRWLGRALDLA